MTDEQDSFRVVADPEDDELYLFSDRPLRPRAVDGRKADPVGGARPLGLAELVRGEVRIDGVRVDYHWWNRLGSGVEVDLTREQFGPDEHVVAAMVIERPPTASLRRLVAEYQLLRGRVFAALGLDRPAG